MFDKGVINDETLGITNIDIDFNTAMVPMITINFVDVRGSSIFQNEENLSGNNSGNKYSKYSPSCRVEVLAIMQFFIL